MAISDAAYLAYGQRLLLSRMRILCENGFFGMLLMHMKYAVDEHLSTACTDGERIVFGAAFLDDLSDRELDFVMMHEILHAALQHCTRGKDLQGFRFNVACDIVVNSIILESHRDDLTKITLRKYGTAMHLAPNGQEGRLYTAEQVYHMLPEKCPEEGWDDHSLWGNGPADEAQKDLWTKRLEDACRAMESRGSGGVPDAIMRVVNALHKGQTDWRRVLREFVQEEVVDYSFLPPDRRRSDSDFFLPDFNEKELLATDVLFMIDTSASMTDAMITAAYSEIKDAIDQFDGKLKGYLGFFDAGVTEPKPFEDEDSFLKIRPKGGGGTSFHAVFDYVREHMLDRPPSTIVILTDGYAIFPEEDAACDIPVLWLLNNEDVTPPWGKIARITLQDA